MGEALAAATRALARRDYSERGVHDRLRRAGIGEPGLDQALTELRNVGLLDDERFAGRRAKALAERGKGDRAIRFDLRTQGLGDELVEAPGAQPRPGRGGAGS